MRHFFNTKIPSRHAKAEGQDPLPQELWAVIPNSTHRSHTYDIPILAFWICHSTYYLKSLTAGSHNEWGTFSIPRYQAPSTRSSSTTRIMGYTQTTVVRHKGPPVARHFSNTKIPSRRAKEGQDPLPQELWAAVPNSSKRSHTYDRPFYFGLLEKTFVLSIKKKRKKVAFWLWQHAPMTDLLWYSYYYTPSATLF